MIERIKRRFGHRPHGLMPHHETDANVYVWRYMVSEPTSLRVPRDRGEDVTLCIGQKQHVFDRFGAAYLLHLWRERERQHDMDG